MKLTAEEIEQAAKLLCKSALELDYDHLSDSNKKTYRAIVVILAGKLTSPRSPELIQTFMDWMAGKIFDMRFPDR